MLDSLTKKQKIIFFIILLIMIIIIIYYIYSTLYATDFTFSYEDSSLLTNDLIETSNTETDLNNFNIPYSETNNIIVYICGAVKNSKVVTLKENSRICDAIEAAGGLTDEADLTTINLAYILEDGEKIYIPQKGENIEEHLFSNPNNQTSSYASYSSNNLKNSKININKASQTELEIIPGIGPSTALKIIDYRERNGNFSSIEDIKNVSGIGEAKFEKIKNYIRIN